MRTLREEEPMPQGFETGFETMPVDGNFCWVAEDECGDIHGLLLASPCHGAMFLVKLKVTEGAPPLVAAMILRHFMRDSEARGYKGYFTFVNPTVEAESRLIGICRRASGRQFTTMHVPIAGKFEEAARY